MKYVFGPVPSRRLGRSLGIDTVPLKTCNWNCVYCQLGRSKPVVAERREYFPTDEILAEARAYLAEHGPEEIDWITFVASGEGTLHTGLGRLVREVKQLTPLPVAVITNGTTLYLPDVRHDLSAADAVMPSFDAGTEELYRRIHRPHPAASFQRHLDGAVAFRDEYAGRLWIEVMLMSELNDSEEALGDLAAALERVRPDEIHLLLPTRPPVETWVKPADEAGLARAESILGRVARVVTPNENLFDLTACGDVVRAIVGIITRHPMSEEQLIHALGDRRPSDVADVLNDLRESGRAQVVERNGVRFWSAATAEYPDSDQSRRTEPHGAPTDTSD